MDIQTAVNAVLVLEGVLVVGSMVHYEVVRRRVDRGIEDADERRFEEASRLLSAPDGQGHDRTDSLEIVE